MSGRAPEIIRLGHGSGGRLTHDLVSNLFQPLLANPALDPLGDSAVIEIADRRFALTTDAHVVTPLEFPGGDIGRLAVNGTINDLAMSGARPIALAAAFIMEEGLDGALLERITTSLADAAREARVPVVTGDTKVVERGSADGLFITTTGLGVFDPSRAISDEPIAECDRILVSGPIGDHGVTIMARRGEIRLDVDLKSDCAPLHDLVKGLLEATDGVKRLRDPTRGGVATVLCEIAEEHDLAIRLEEESVPVRPAVRAACDILGLDPLYVACEGRLVAFVTEREAPVALAALQRHPLGAGAAIIGAVVPGRPGRVTVSTRVGGERVIGMLSGDQIPRIC
jgi:hydrogenase expression/formation protein HypE